MWSTVRRLESCRPRNESRRPCVETGRDHSTPLATMRAHTGPTPEVSIGTRRETRDDTLIELAKRGDRDAFMSLVRRHDDRLRGLAYRLLGDRDRMDDALQEAYLRAYSSFASFRGGSDVGTWLYRIVYNACIDELRRGRRRPEPVDTTRQKWDRVSPRPGPEALAAVADVTARALAALPLDQRLAVVLVDGEGFENVTAARILGVAPGTIASRLSRGRAAMRRAIGDQG
jgi:RNA polymerase sigma-70 factor (ECF subfamily)